MNPANENDSQSKEDVMFQILKLNLYLYLDYQPPFNMMFYYNHGYNQYVNSEFQNHDNAILRYLIMKCVCLYKFNVNFLYFEVIQMDLRHQCQCVCCQHQLILIILIN